MVSLQWDNIEYAVGDKEILRGISGKVNAGGTLATLGPSGCWMRQDESVERAERNDQRRQRESRGEWRKSAAGGHHHAGRGEGEGGSDDRCRVVRFTILATRNLQYRVPVLEISCRQSRVNSEAHPKKIG